MFRSMDITGNLKSDILELKKELTALKNDNHLLKVKIRKQQSEISKKDKQIETLLDPDRAFHVKRVLSEKGASMVVTLRDRIKKLENVIHDKDGVIKRLQHDLQTKKLYTLKSADKKKPTVNSNKHNLTIPFFEKECDFEVFKSLQSHNRSLSLHNILDEFEKNDDKRKRSNSAERYEALKLSNDVKDQYKGLPKSHLLSIIENLKNQQKSPIRRQTESPESDIERLECDTPHPEVQQLQNYFMDILNEVDHLKVTISSLKNEQDRTNIVLNEKDLNIERLAQEIEFLRKTRSKNKTDKGTRIQCLDEETQMLLNSISGKHEV